MRGGNRESMYGEYNSGQDNLKPVPVVQILRWQGDRKEWVVIDLVPETTQPHPSDKMSSSKKAQEKTIVKDGCKKLEGISSEPYQSDKISSSKKTQEKSMVENNCKKRITSKLYKSEKMFASNKTQKEAIVKDSCKNLEGITSEPHQSDNISSSKKTEPKEVVKNNCKKPDSIKTCFCFDWKEKVLPVPKCMKKIQDNENHISNARIATVEAKNNKASPCDQITKHKDGNILTYQKSNANPCEDEAFENSPMLPPKVSLIQAFGKTKNNHSNISFNPDGREGGGKPEENSKVNQQRNQKNYLASFERPSDSSKQMTGTFCKTPTKDVEADKVLKAAILVTEATIKTVEEMKAATKCDIVVKNMGYKADIVNKRRPIWNTVAPNTKFNLSKQADNNNSARVTPEHLTTSSAKAGNIGTMKHHQKCPRPCETERTLKKSEAEKDFILGLLNTLIYEVAKKKATEGEETIHDQSLKEVLGNSEILFADEEHQSEQADKLNFTEEKSAVDCAMKTLEEVNGFETSRSWY